MTPPRLLRQTLLLAAFAVGSKLAAMPGILVEGNGIAIEDGDTTPSLTDHTDFGNVAVGTEAGVRVFTITNTGSSPLAIYSVQRIGGSAGAFTVPIAPDPVVAAQASTEFVVWFNPGATGALTTTLRINNNASDDLRHEFRIRGTGTLPAPEINLLGNDMVITAGDPFPSTDDGTDFGSADVDQGESVTHTFTIENLGEADLTITDVQRIGGDTGDFRIRNNPSGTVRPGDDTTFKVEFEPTTTGLRRTTIRILNNDSNESSYDFVVQGFGSSLAPEINLVGNGISIPNGDHEPSNDDHTSFGSAPVTGGSTTRTFTIENLGNTALELHSVQVAGDHAADFSIPSPPGGPVLAGGSVDFDVVFDPGAEGLRQATLRISSTDADEDPYDVGIQGFGGSFKFLRVERDGNDAIVHFTSNPDTTFSTHIYTLQHNPGNVSAGWNGVGFLSVSGGGEQQIRHLNGWTGPAGLWRIFESAIP